MGLSFSSLLKRGNLTAGTKTLCAGNGSLVLAVRLLEREL